jgi:hypothetical protein
MRTFQQNCEIVKKREYVDLVTEFGQEEAIHGKKDKSDSDCANLLFAKSLPDLASCDK